MALPYFFLPDHDEPSPRLRERRDDVRGAGESGAEERQLPDDLLERDRALRIRAGDEGAYAELFREVHVALREFATTYVHSAALAEEIVQDVFLDLWIRRVEWAPARGIRAYLFRAVRNRATDTTRRSRVAAQGRSSAVRWAGWRASGRWRFLASVPSLRQARSWLRSPALARAA